MSPSLFTKVYRLGFGLLILVAVIVQLFTFRQTPVNYLSYFTVLSNLLVSFVLLASVFTALRSKHLDQVRGAAVLYIWITFLGFTLLLGGRNEEFLPWTNIVCHFISPAIMLLDWIFVPSTILTMSTSLYWILSLLIYLAYSMIRGFFTGWYPYGFLNPAEVGNGGVITYVGIITLGTLFLSFVFIKSTIFSSSLRPDTQS